jgi:hypothetical protein
MIPLAGTCFPADDAALIQSIPEMLTYKRRVLVVQGTVVLAPEAHECSTTGENRHISLIHCLTLPASSESVQGSPL